MDDILNKTLEIFGVLPEYAQAIFILITGLVTTATAFTMATPTKVDDEKLPLITKPLNFVLGLLNSVAGNLLKNTNADAVEPDPVTITVKK